MLKPITPSADAWDAFIAGRRDAGFLQTPEWGALKSRFGWSASLVALADEAGSIAAGAQVLYRRLPLGFGTLGYVPRGPLVDWERPEVVGLLLAALDADARRRRAFALKVEPPFEDSPDAARCLRALGFRPSPHTVQPPRTVVIDIDRAEDAILETMKQKTRYNVRLGARKGVTVRAGVRADLASFSALMQTTGARDGSGVHAPEYYETAYDLFVPKGRGALLLASYEGQDLAGIMVLALGRRAVYWQGASSDAHRNLMPSYLVQWEGIQWARAHGCEQYDLWGVPDEDFDTLEAHFAGRSDGLWGVYRFKRGWGGRLVRMVGAWDRVYNPLLYAVYRRLAARNVS
ncbi:MAG: peptidoglycan bridge formation glycyltransferase FemA/FemB family protein [Anaerolineae bacterium]|nr:peptidoglycan bridge formation glycyltransferase FemA/FemB family protein [Anaerolineae bacterium]